MGETQGTLLTTVHLSALFAIENDSGHFISVECVFFLCFQRLYALCPVFCLPKILQQISESQIIQNAHLCLVCPQSSAVNLTASNLHCIPKLSICPLSQPANQIPLL